MQKRVLYIGVFICVIQLSFSSCTVLQWRQTDAEILAYFDAKKVPTSISYFDIDSLHLKIRTQQVARSKTNINLLFLHGSPSSMAAWNGYLTDSSLAQSAQLHALDRPGYGYSNFGHEIPSISLQAEIIDNLIDGRKMQNVVVVGASYGGPLAARLAVLNENVKGVVMISPAIDPKQEKKIWASRLTQWWLTRWLVPTGYRVAGDEKTVHAQELAKIEKDWGKVAVPVLHFHGDLDEIVPYQNIEYTVRRFSNNTIISIPGTGHEIAYAHSEQIIPHILDLIHRIK